MSAFFVAECRLPRLARMPDHTTRSLVPMCWMAPGGSDHAETLDLGRRACRDAARDARARPAASCRASRASRHDASASSKRTDSGNAASAAGAEESNAAPGGTRAAAGRQARRWCKGLFLVADPERRDQVAG